MSDIAALVSDHLDIWTAATERKSSAGRGGGKRVSLYGIERLRALILDLAVRGRLVPQDEHDGTGSALLEAIEAERKRQFSSGETKRLSSPDPLNDAPFPIPESWAWTQIGIVTNYGETEKADPGSVDDDTWVLELEDVEKGTSRLIERVTHSTRKFQSQKNRFRVGDVIYGKLRPYLDKVLIADTPGVCTTEMVPMRAYHGVEAAYLRLFLKSPFFISFADGSTHGMNLPRLGTDKARAAPFSLPPLAEQRRIVAKVDELMALCDALEGESAAALAAHQTLVETLLATLVNSAHPADLAANWSRLEAHFDTLFTTEASIDALKQTILELAVRGRLVSQNAADEPASELLRKIIASNSKRVATGQSKKMRSESAVRSGPAPFGLPPSWVWTSLDRLAFKLTDGAHHTPTYTDEGVPFLSVKDMSSGTLDFSDTRFISAEQHSELYQRCDPEKGDLLITKVGTTGIPVIVDTEKPFSLFVSVALVKAPWDLVSVEFLRLLVDSPFVRKQSAEGTQGIGNKNLVLRTIGAFQIPLPPLAEQKRIVTKVDALIALCDDLKARTADAGQTQMRLADAIVERAAA